MWAESMRRIVSPDPERVTGPGGPDRRPRGKECEMTSPSIAALIPSAQGTGRALRLLLVTLAILVIATVTFVVGRVTANGSSSAPANVPAVSRQMPASSDSGVCQQVGHYLSAGC